ncbi:iron-hydroxamate ABC transporter substrate-binding protein [Alkalihalobacillus pseudalcaliphilus]|uniref:iron-hydroxamate ABC transporter substrate-binding protein n=1 Tax=Alkalihalobacillus pseudalcaliphilus TaxID=79884 RepID=UPI00064D8A0A|nr:iron-hydroxamate ABC transporter substrate-binding protein [Alkalihalobacillus pseudalcaliphilus]KMK74934.1 ABC transporter substrate-binding protein [Alkalihalobacillus pseudalcaliphilus]
MKKAIMNLAIVFLFLLLVSACGQTNSSESQNEAPEEKNETITYESENGPVEVPANPERVVVLGGFTGNVMALDANLAGVESWAKSNPRFIEQLEDVEEVSDESLEKIIELEPDLIIGYSTTKNIDKLKQIAPTVTYTYGAVDYLTQHIEIGKVLNKEKEATEWVNDFKERAKVAGDDIRAHIGEEATVSVIENFDKQLYVFGDNWGRGTEILYQEMKLKMPEKVKEMALADGYYALSVEVLDDYVGDYLVVSKSEETEGSFQETDTYQNMDAVKNNRVFQADASEFYFNDPITLDYQLEFFINSFLESE